MVEDGLILHEKALLIPLSEHDDTLWSLHEAHQGYVKTLLCAYKMIYWPGLDKDEEQLIAACSTHQHIQLWQADPHLNSNPLLIDHERPLNLIFLILMNQHIASHWHVLKDVACVQTPCIWNWCQCCHYRTWRTAFWKYTSNAFADFTKEWHNEHVTAVYTILPLMDLLSQWSRLPRQHSPRQSIVARTPN